MSDISPVLDSKDKTVPNMENSTSKETPSPLKPVRPAILKTKTLQTGSSTIPIAGIKRKNDDETSMPPPSTATEANGAVGTGKSTTQQLPVKKKILKSTSSRRIQPKPRKSGKATPLRKHGQSIHEKKNGKKAAGISIGARKKAVSVPVKKPSTKNMKYVGEEDNQTKTAVDVTDITTVTPSSAENPPAKAPVQTSTSLDVFNKGNLYQHLGQLNPTWNIPALKENEKPMKAFCAKFKAPKKNKPNNDADVPNAPAEPAVEPAAEEASVETRQEVGEKDDGRSGPLVEIIDGEIVIKQSSVIVVGERKTTADVDKELVGDGGVVEEDDHGLTATYTSFSDKFKSHRWKVDETRIFYNVLRQCGTDFSTMEQMYAGFDMPKTRKQLKGKYKRELKKNPRLIDMCMNPSAQIPLDLTLFGDLDFDTVPQPSSTATKQSADDDETEATPMKTVSDGSSLAVLQSNDKVKHDIDPIVIKASSQSNISKQEHPLAPVKVSGKDDEEFLVEKSEIILDGAAIIEKVEEKPSPSISDSASTVMVKEKSEDSNVKPVEKPIALFGVRKKATTKRPKFRVAKARPKKNKAK